MLLLVDAVLECGFCLVGDEKKNKGKVKEKAREARREDAVGNFLLDDNEMGMILNFEFPG